MSQKIIIAEDGTNYIPRRQYKGVVVTAQNYQELLKEGGRKLINFHNAHLKAYLAGKTIYNHGTKPIMIGDTKIGSRPIERLVEQNIYMEPVTGFKIETV